MAWSTKRFLRTRVGTILVAVTIVVVVCSLFVTLRPLPGRDLVMATGPSGSAYARVAEQYRQILARDGVRLHLVPTNGAMDNLRLLRNRRSGIATGFVQAGTVAESDAQELLSLGTVFYEVAWVFCGCPGGSVPLNGWSGWRVSIGPEGSASRVLALKLLALNGLAPGQLQLFAYPPEEAARALLSRQLDAALILTGWESPAMQTLARAPDITLLGFPRADAYVALNPVLSKLILPRGAVDLAADRPAEDTPLIGSKASLAVRSDLHPALQFLLLRAAQEVHSPPGMFQRAGEFPAPETIDLPLSRQAQAFYRSGPNFLQRTLPFWLAELVQRILFLVVPLVAIVYPLWSLVPKIYYWQWRRRLYPLYRELRRLERELRAAAPALRGALIERLDELDRRAADLAVPWLLAESNYVLRSAIQRAQSRIAAEAAGKPVV